MARITRICSVALVAMLASPAFATSPSSVEQFANARIAEIGGEDRLALAAYLKLYKKAPDSPILADRLFESAIRSGDMASAVRAARAKELNSGGDNETAMLLFADAWRAKNWAMADLAADELALSGNLAFVAPMLKSWVQISQGKTANLPEADTQNSDFFAYYSNDQRIYLDLASGRYAAAKVGLRAIAGQPGEYVRDVLIAGAQTLAANDSSPVFAEALMRSAIGSTEGLAPRPGRFPAELGLASIYTRLAATLIEQSLPEEGLVLARVAHWIAPSLPQVQITLAKALNANGLMTEALALLAQTPSSSPYRLNSLETRVNMLLASDQLAMAKDAVLQAAEATPNSVAIKLLDARVDEAAGNLPAVIATYRQLTEAADFSTLPPRQQAGYRQLLASALDQTGDWPAARRELELLLMVDPNNAQALNYLGYSLLEKGGEQARATELVKRAYALEPLSSAITDSLGWAYYLQGDALKALPLLESAAKAAGNDGAINEHLGDVYWTVGRRKDARYAWQVASQTSQGAMLERLARKIDVGLSEPVR